MALLPPIDPSTQMFPDMRPHKPAYECSDAAFELYLYVGNCAPAWNICEAAFRNYERKRAKGVYDPALARKGLSYAIERAAREYVSDHCDRQTRWHTMFPPADRAAVAHMVMSDAESEWDAGNYWGDA